MSFSEKADIRIDHWIKHSQSHLADYAAFADELERNGHPASAAEIRAMAELTQKSVDHLRNARIALK